EFRSMTRWCCRSRKGNLTRGNEVIALTEELLATVNLPQSEGASEYTQASNHLSESFRKFPVRYEAKLCLQMGIMFISRDGVAEVTPI
ncbi:hypothetical protein MKW98_016712, partial [Papaver atlanticum]